MTATQDLIAASLTAADKLDIIGGHFSITADGVRELCARAMVQPDMAEVERLAHAHADAKLIRYGLMHSVEDVQKHDPDKACAALLDYVRGHFGDSDKMVQPVGDVPEIRFGNMLDCRTCAHFTADGCNSTVMCGDARQYKATAPRRYWAALRGEVKP